MSYYNLINAYSNDIPIEKFENRELFYIHIPKTGGSLIENMFYDHKLGAFIDSSKWDSLKIDDNITGVNNWHTPPKYIKNLDFTKVLAFASIRNPIDKILSEYIWEGSNSNINRWVINKINKHKVNNFIDDNHWEPQVSYIVDAHGNQLPYENMIICDSKNFVNNILKFAKKYNISTRDYFDSIPSKTSLPHPILGKPQNKCNNKIHSNNTDYNALKEKLSLSTINFIKDYYKEDFKLYEILKRYN